MNIYEFNIRDKFRNIPLYARTSLYDRTTGEYEFTDVNWLVQDGQINCFRPHIHAPVEILYICDGEMTERFGDEVMTVGAGDLLVADPYQPHSALLDVGQERVQYAFAIFEPDKFCVPGMTKDKVTNTMVDYGSGLLGCANRIKADDATRRLGGLILEMSELFRKQDGSGIAVHNGFLDENPVGVDLAGVDQLDGLRGLIEDDDVMGSAAVGAENSTVLHK